MNLMMFCVQIKITVFSRHRKNHGQYPWLGKEIVRPPFMGTVHFGKKYTGRLNIIA